MSYDGTTTRLYGKMRNQHLWSQFVRHSSFAVAFILAVGLDYLLPAVEFQHCFDLNPYRILVPIDGQPGVPLAGFAVLDTGAGMIAIDPLYRSLLRGDAVLKPVVTATGYAMVRFQTTARFKIGGYPVPAGLISSEINLSTYREAEGINMMVVAGYPLFSGKTLDLDPEADVVRILEQFPEDIDLSSFTKLPFTISQQGAIDIAVRVDGLLLHLGVDTGNSDFMSLKLNELLNLQKIGKVRANMNQSNVESVNGMIGISSLIGSNFTIDRFHFSSVNISPGVTSNLGMQFLHNFRCLIDYYDKALYLRPTPEYANYRPLGPVPFQIRWVHDAVTMVIEPGSPYYALGLRSGFILQTINEKPVMQLGFFKAYDLLRDHHQPVVLQCTDDTGQSRTVTLPKAL
jgi:hypothetical protein